MPGAHHRSTLTHGGTLERRGATPMEGLKERKKLPPTPYIQHSTFSTGQWHNLWMAAIVVTDAGLLDSKVQGGESTQIQLIDLSQAPSGKGKVK